MHLCTLSTLSPLSTVALDLEAMSRRTLVITLAAVLLVASAVAAQFRGRGGRQGFNGRPLQYAKLEDFDGGFQFCRLVFRNGSNGDGAGWNVDFPRADENLSIRLSELTRVPVSMDEKQTTVRAG